MNPLGVLQCGYGKGSSHFIQRDLEFAQNCSPCLSLTGAGIEEVREAAHKNKADPGEWEGGCGEHLPEATSLLPMCTF